MAFSLLRRCPLLIARQSHLQITAPMLRSSPPRYVLRLLNTEAPKSSEPPKGTEAPQNPSIPPKKIEKSAGFTFSWRALGISVVIFGVMVQILWVLKRARKKEIDSKKVQSIGKAAIGGDFELVDTKNKKVTLSDFSGKWVLIYFGFTHCPDICPEELEKMSLVVDMIDKKGDLPPLQPLFISVDPERDTPELISKYTADFSPRLQGLTGTIDQIKDVCKTYRIYYSAGPKEDGDYIVDHTIIMYLLNPKGEFQQYYGRNKTAEEVYRDIFVRMNMYKE